MAHAKSLSNFPQRPARQMQPANGAVVVAARQLRLPLGLRELRRLRLRLVQQLCVERHRASCLFVYL